MDVNIWFYVRWYISGNQSLYGIYNSLKNSKKKGGGSIPFLFCYCIFLLCWYFKSIISARSTHCPLNEHSAQISICLLFIKNNNIFKIRLSLDMNFCIHFKMYILSLLSQRIIILWAFFATFVAFRYSCNYQVSMRRTIIQNGSWFQADYQKFFFLRQTDNTMAKRKRIKMPTKVHSTKIEKNLNNTLLISCILSCSFLEHDHQQKLASNSSIL